MAFQLFNILFPLLALIGWSSADVSVNVVAQNSWQGGAQYKLVLRNNGPNRVCAVNFQLDLNGGSLGTSWNMEPAGGNNQFKTPSWMQLDTGAPNDNAGLVVNGNSAPTVTMVSSQDCDGGGGNPPPTTQPTTVPPSGGDGGAKLGPLIWSDEFDGPQGQPPNPANWVHNIGNKDTNVWGNQELEYYTDSTDNAALDGSGNLVITARFVPDGKGSGPCWHGATCNYTSARLTTGNKFSQTYGRFEARMKLPRGQGMWPAFWMLGVDFLTKANWPNCGEIDIMETVGKSPSTVFGTLHGPVLNGANGPQVKFDLPNGQQLADAFHTFAVDWTKDSINWYIDGQSYGEQKASAAPAGQWVYNYPFYILLNLAVGGSWPGSPDANTVFPQQMVVDYVRVYQLL